MQAAGVTDGVFNLVHGFSPNSAGEFISRHPDISAITFTCESRTGTTIMRADVEGVKRRRSSWVARTRRSSSPTVTSTR
ncbi:aldehyde dehydrogenase family protein [Pseudomonas reinekei]|nr:aldehyde dehydrogenase family protein [Pseudomonas reinekei]